MDKRLEQPVDGEPEVQPPTLGTDSPSPSGEGPGERESARAESEALIEQFLAGSRVRDDEALGMEAPGEDGLPSPEGAGAGGEGFEVPEGHRSGFVALIGRPNVGKSTLVNALVGQKVAIVSPKPQTTRTRVRGILTAPDHQMIFVDTPGIHKSPPHRLNRMMIDAAVAAIPDADVILFVVDVSARPREEDQIIAELLREKAGTHPVFFVLNKMDQLALEQAEARIEAYWALLPTYADSIPVSALKGTNLDLLHDRMLARLPEGPRYFPGDQITDQTEHQIASELIREALLRTRSRRFPTLPRS
jgi:GTPase